MLQKNLCDILVAAKHNFPHRPALICEGKSWNYDEVYQQAILFAAHIQKNAAKTNAPGCIAIYGNKSLASIAAILGSLLAGYAYLPIDITWPAERIASILKKANPSLLIVTELNLYLQKQLSQLQELPPILDGTHLPPLQDNVPLPKIDPEDIAYLLFTSGTTGSPKGVCVSHRAAIAAISMLFEHVSLDREDKIANQAALCYDLTMFDLFSAFSVGASVHLLPAHIVKVPPQFLRYLQEHRLTSLFMVSSALEYSLKYSAAKTTQIYLKTLLLTGDPISENLVNLLKTKLPNCKIYNLYSAVEMPYAFAQNINLQSDSLNLRLFLEHGSQIHFHLQNDDTPTPSEGALIVKSPVLFSGYLTSERSLADIRNHPVTQYATGDWVKSVGSGIELYGRIDRQVKILGNRVELDDIEANVELSPWVQECAIHFDKSRENITAFIVIRENFHELNNIKNLLKEWCQTKMPAVMIPHDYVLIEAMPRTTSGKRDRKLLVQQYLHATELV